MILIKNIIFNDFFNAILYNYSMRRVILLIIITIGFIHAIEYKIVNVPKGGRVNVREVPIVNSITKVGTIPSYAVGIKIKDCKYGRDGKEWCYISYPMGARHLDGWVRKYYLAPMGSDFTSNIYIKSFLQNFYKSDEENFLDKLKVFYYTPMQQYFYMRNVNLIQLRTAKVNFYKKWSVRRYNLLSFKILRKKSNYIDVKTVVRWRLKNRYESSSGVDIQKVRLVPTNGEFKVLAIKNLKHIVDTDEIIWKEVNSSTSISSDSNIITRDKQFYIKVGSFFSNPNRNYLEKILQNGFHYIIKEVMQDGAIIKRVYIGPYNTSDEVEKNLKTVREKINRNAYIQSF